MSWMAVGGAAVSAVGAGINANNAPTMRWKPMGSENLWGSTKFDKKNKRIEQNLSGFSQGVAGGFQDQATALGGSPLIGIGNQLAQGAAGDAGGAYQAANQYGMPAQSVFDNAYNGMGAYNQGFAGLAQAASQNPYAQTMMNYGQGFMNTGYNSYNDVFNQKFQMLNDAAQPFEERAQNSLMSKLYSMGQLGTPGGQLGMESFGRGQSQAYTQRGVDAMNLSEGLYGRDQAFAGQQQAMGANLFSQGANQWLHGLNTAGNMGQLGMQGLAQQYNTGVGWNTLGYNRATDRLARTGEMFGFGNTVSMTPSQQQATYMNLLSGITGETNTMAELGLRAAGPQGAVAGGNPVAQTGGAFLGSLGNAMATGGGGFGSWNQPNGGVTGLSPGQISGGFGQIGAGSMPNIDVSTPGGFIFPRGG
jgi:hypothetical protein